MILRARKAFRLQLLLLVVAFAVLAALVGARSLLIERQQATMIAVREAFELERHVVAAAVAGAGCRDRPAGLPADRRSLLPHALPVRRRCAAGRARALEGRHVGRSAPAAPGSANCTRRCATSLPRARRDHRPLPGRPPRRRAADRAQRSRQGLRGSPSHRRRRSSGKTRTPYCRPAWLPPTAPGNGWAGPLSSPWPASFCSAPSVRSTCAAA